MPPWCVQSDVEKATAATLSGAVQAEARGVFDREKDLIAAIRSGDRAAAEEMVEVTYQTVFGSLFRMCGGDADLAADLTQDTYRKAWESFAKFNGRSKISTWLYRIGYTTFLNYIRGPKRIVSLDPEKGERIEDESPAIDTTLSDTQEAEQLRRVVLDLNDDLRLTVTAHFWGGLSVREIATMENVTTVAIRKRLKKAFRLLEGLLEEETDEKSS